MLAPLVDRFDAVELASLHEAGHGVAAVVLEPAVVLVQIRLLDTDDAGGDFHVRVRSDQAGREAEAVVLHAGRVAEILAGVDRTTADYGAADDMDGLAALMDDAKLTGDARRVFYGRAADRAEALLKRNWDAVLRVAAALRRYHKLDRNDVLELMQGGPR